MRLVADGEIASSDPEVVDAFESCVQCRGCEPACPSGVPFGRMISTARGDMVTEIPATNPWWMRVGLRALGHHSVILAGATMVAWGQRVGGVPRSKLPVRLPLRRPAIPAPPAKGDPVWVLTGCVMDAVSRSTHIALVEVLTALGWQPMLPSIHEGCCGALAHHGGLETLATRQTQRAMARFRTSEPGRSLDDAPIVIDSAGCGAHLKEHGGRGSSRIVDAMELIATRADRLAALVDPSRRRPTVIVQDPCHLRHVQRVHAATRVALAPVADVVELDDDGLCCGAGGAYSLLQPAMATELRDRKILAIDRAGGANVVSANPGCALHLAGGGISVSHPVEIIAAVLRARQHNVDHDEGARHGR